MKDHQNKGPSRRDFMKCTAVLGGAALAAEIDWAHDLIRRAEAGTLTRPERNSASSIWWL